MNTLGEGSSGDGFRLDVSGDASGYISFVKTYSGGSNSEIRYSGFSVTGNGSPFSGIEVILAFADHSPPLKYLPPVVGQTWTDIGDSNGYRVDSTTVVTSATETISVVAGNFTNCVKTEITYSYPGGYTPGQIYRTSQESWFAPGIGPVQVIIRRSNGSEYHGELTTFANIVADPNDYFPLGLNFQWTFIIDGGNTATWTVSSLF